MATPFSARISDELKSEINAAKEASGLKNHDEFLAALLLAYQERQEDTDMSSPVRKEQIKVRQALAQAERVIGAYLELASADKKQAEDNAQESVGMAEDKVATVTALNQELKLNLENIRTNYNESQKSLKALQEKEANVQALQTAWRERETTLNARLTELDAEAKQARELSAQVVLLEKQATEKDSALAMAEQKSKTDSASILDFKERLQKEQERFDAEVKQARELSAQVATLEKQAVEKNSALALAEQKSKTDHASIADLKNQLEKIQNRFDTQDTELATVRSDLAQARDAVAQEKINCSTQLAAVAEEKGLLSGELIAVKAQRDKPVTKTKI